MTQIAENSVIEYLKFEIIIFWSDEDNTYIAYVPELPGCMA